MSSELATFSVEDLVQAGVLAPPIDGNHGEIHPKASDFVPSGVPFIMASDLKGGRVDLQNCAFITHEQAASLRKGFSKAGDVLLSHKATLGRTALVGPCDHDYLVLTPQVTYYRVLDASRLNNRYLKYYFDSGPFQQTLAAWAGAGSTRAYIGITAQRKLPIVLPPIEVQDAIAEVIGALDDRITLLRETNATLEAIAQALFKSWFVDFDPVRAKLDGRAPEGMDEATAALFPDSFKDSELGEVPRGWSHCSLKEVTKIFDSIRVPLSGAEREKRRGKYPYYGAAALMDHVDAYLFDGVYLLTGEDGSVADANGFPITQYVWGKFWVNNHAHVLQGANGICTEHLMLAVKQTNIAPYITGAVQAKLSQSNMWRIQFLRPSAEVASAFGNLVEPLFASIRHNSEEAETLSTLRDTLLPRLISGQLRLPTDQQAAHHP